MPHDASGELLPSNAIAVEQQSNDGEIVPGKFHVDKSMKGGHP